MLLGTRCLMAPLMLCIGPVRWWQNELWSCANWDNKLGANLDLTWPARSSLLMYTTNDFERHRFLSRMSNTRNQQDNAALVELSLVWEVTVTFSFTKFHLQVTANCENWKTLLPKIWALNLVLIFIGVVLIVVYLNQNFIGLTTCL